VGLVSGEGGGGLLSEFNGIYFRLLVKSKLR